MTTISENLDIVDEDEGSTEPERTRGDIIAEIEATEREINQIDPVQRLDALRIELALHDTNNTSKETI